MSDYFIFFIFSLVPILAFAFNKQFNALNSSKILYEIIFLGYLLLWFSWTKTFNPQILRQKNGLVFSERHKGNGGSEIIFLGVTAIYID